MKLFEKKTKRLHDDSQATMQRILNKDSNFAVVETYKVDQESVEQLSELMLDIEFWYYSDEGAWWESDSSWWESHGQHLQRARQESE